MTALSTVPLPATIAAVDGQWLTAALRESGVIGPVARVATVEARRIALETGFSSELYRLRLTGDGGVPASVVVKMPTGTAVREAMDLVGGRYAPVTGRCVAGQSAEVFVLLPGQPQRPAQRIEDRHRRAAPALLEALDVVGGHSRQRAEFLAAQSRGPPPNACPRNPHQAGRHTLSPPPEGSARDPAVLRSHKRQ